MCVRGLENSFRRSNKFLFLTFGQSVYVFEVSRKQFKILWVMPFGLAIVDSTEKCESLDIYVTSPRSFIGCGKCGALLFVQKASFTLQEHVKTTETDETGFFFVRKR